MTSALAEDGPGRRSLVRHCLGSVIAPDFLTIADIPDRAGGFGRHPLTALGRPATRTDLVRRGVMVGLLDSSRDGPWRGELGHETPAPRMTWLSVEGSGSSRQVDAALGRAAAPIIEVYRCGLGSLDHRTGMVVLDVKDATLDGHRLWPFAVVFEARLLLRAIEAVGGPDSIGTWTAYCLGASGNLPVGADTPEVVTPVVSTAPARWLN